MVRTVGVLGATGIVGQRLVTRLIDHPLFELGAVAASPDSVGARYADAVTWRIDEPCPPDIAEITIDPCEPGGLRGDPDLVLSALPSDVAATVEPAFCTAGVTVCSNARYARMDPDVPLIIPEVNADHIELVEQQRRDREWAGALVKNPNCTAATVTLPLAALSAFHPTAARVVTMQAISGAGASGVASLDIVDNLLPRIPGEADKLAAEPTKLLGTVRNDTIAPHPIAIDAVCHRVPVVDGHFATAWVDVEKPPSRQSVVSAFETFNGITLPSAPDQPIRVTDRPRRPQPRLDRDAGDGMAVTIGGIEVIDTSVRFDCLAHNTVRGAAGACLLTAELADTVGY